MSTYKLSIEMLPISAWKLNIRNLFPKEIWESIRKDIYKRANYTCELCGETNTVLSAHERWEFDSNSNKQKLKDIICLCNNCHMVIHWGYAELLSLKNEVDLNELKNHFTKVNNCEVEDFEIHLKNQTEEWELLNKTTWEVDMDSILEYRIT